MEAESPVNSTSPLDNNPTSPPTYPMTENLSALELAMTWLKQVFRTRGGQGIENDLFKPISLPPLPYDLPTDSTFAKFIAQHRLSLHEVAIPPQAQLEEIVDLRAIADKYALTGAAIMNVVRYASLKAIDREDQIIRQRDLVEGIRRGFLKEGKVM
jgi:hypothetical protein